MAWTTAGALLPTLVTEIPDPKSMSRLPSTSSMIPASARVTNTGRVVPTPWGTAAALRAASALEAGPGISVMRWRPTGVVGALRFGMVGPPLGGTLSLRGDGAHDVLDPRVVLE